MKILITGAHGQLGRSLQRALEHHDVAEMSHAELDVGDAGAVADAIRRVEPDCVINCAALTDTTLCEHDRRLASRINTLGAANVARVIGQLDNSFAVLISTDEVFDGIKRVGYTEDDDPHPINAYGASKLEGERLAGELNTSPLIIRTSWLYGDGGNNFPSKVIAAARAGRPLRFVTNEISVPTSTDDLARAISALIEQPWVSGIFHLVNGGEASRYEWAREILRLAGMADIPIEPVTMAELRGAGYDGPRKPEYSVLANTRARALGITLRPWHEALAAYFESARVTADG